MDNYNERNNGVNETPENNESSQNSNGASLLNDQPIAENNQPLDNTYNGYNNPSSNGYNNPSSPMQNNPYVSAGQNNQYTPNQYNQYTPNQYNQYTPNQYGQQGGYSYQQPSEPEKPGKGLGIAGFVLSLVSFFSCCIGGIIMVAVTNTMALIFSIIGRSKARKVNQKNGLATAGMIISIIHFAFWLLLVLMVVLIFSLGYGEEFKEAFREGYYAGAEFTI